jgi:HSP20 family protein
VIARRIESKRRFAMLLANRNHNLPPLFELRRQLDRLFDNFDGGQPVPLFGTRGFPALNAWEDGHRIMVEAEVPGMGMDDLEISVQGNELTLKGQRKTLEGDDVLYHRRERSTREFTRSLTLPVEIDADHVEAVLKDGVLSISLPKSEKARARKIAVRTA